MAREGYAAAPLSAPEVLFVAIQMPVSIRGMQSKEGALAKQGAVTRDVPSEGFQIVRGRGYPFGPANLSRLVAVATAGSPEIVIDSGNPQKANTNTAASLSRIEFDNSGIDTDSRGSGSRSQNGGHMVSPNGVADASAQNPTPGWCAH